MDDKHKIKENQDQSDLPKRDEEMTNPAGTKGGISDYSQTNKAPIEDNEELKKDGE